MDLKKIAFIFLSCSIGICDTISVNETSDKLDQNQTLFENHSLTSLIIGGFLSHKRYFYAQMGWYLTPLFCGATVIEEKFILTAALCVYRYKGKLKSELQQLAHY